MSLNKKIEQTEARLNEGVYLIQNQNGAFYTDEAKWSFMGRDAHEFQNEVDAEDIMNKLVHNFKRAPRVVLTNDVCSYGYEVDIEDDLKIKRIWSSTKQFTNIHFENYFKNDIEAELFVEDYPNRESKKKLSKIDQLRKKLKELESEM